MGLLDGIMNRHRKGVIPAHATFRLTEQGRERLQRFDGDPRSRVLTALETNGTSSVDEIARSSGLGRGQVERIVPNLLRGGFVQYTGAAQMENSED